MYEVTDSVQNVEQPTRSFLLRVYFCKKSFYM